MTHQAPEDLRARLDRAAPSSYPALDVDAALERGRRTVRRRRVGTALVAAAVAVVAAGSIFFGGGLRLSSPQPADPSHVAGVVSWSLPQTVSGGGETDYMVVVHIPDGEHQQVDFVHVTDSGPQTFARTVIDLRHPLATWKASPGSQVVLGLIPSTSVSQVQLDAGGGMGPNTAVIPHVGWTAFSFVLGRSGAGASTFRGIQWSDLQHRPIDAQGRPGTVAPLGSGCWATSSADHRDLGLDCGAHGVTSFSHIVTTPDVLWAQGFSSSDGVHQGLGVPRGSTGCIVRDASGQEQPLPTVQLGQYQFGLHNLTFRDGTGHADSVRCRDSSGTQREYRLP
ncbi:hypothetical protein [Lapillicoccus sp.]|uniref:hypothetical protein n=1 Tax=Lapillicoccus sp. TaxID=1909287 RepID=UPI0025E6EA24|nr:hypothetical protein [Lapillicoccus sp.]